MEVHKPKPIHSWREFFKEYAIIVLGVATALAGEQAVEWLHWRSEVSHARQALRAEMSVIVNFWGRRAQVASCMDRKLDTLAARIADAAAGRQPDISGITFNNLGTLLNDSEWQSERSSQTLTHFPRQELALMSRFYGQVMDARGWASEESRNWSGLAVLQDAGQTLGPADLAELRRSLHLIRRFHYLITLNAGRQLAIAAQLGLAPAALSPAELADFCNRTSVQVKY